MRPHWVFFLAAVAALALFANPARALYITEFMAVNDTTITDDDGDFSDWLEIHNDGATAVDLGGYYLTDKSDNLTKWQLPSLVLPAGT